MNDVVPHGWQTDGVWEDMPAECHPINDLKPHILGGRSPCWCNVIDDDGVLVHNAMDGREAYELGIRKPS